MAQLSINTLWNANVYIEGVSYLGNAAEIEIPQPVRKTADYQALGMIGGIEIPVGWERLESRIRWVSFVSSAFAVMATAFKILSLSALGDMQVIQSSGVIAELPVTYNMTGFFKDVGRLAMRGQENAETESSFVCYHVELFSADLPIYSYDAISNTYTVLGVDQLATYAANIGV